MKNIPSFHSPFLLLFCALFFLSWHSPAYADSYSAEILDISSKQKLYHFESNSIVKGEFTEVEMKHTDPSGGLVIVENALLKNDELVKYQISHKQLQMEGSIEVKDKTLYFQKTSSGGKIKESKETKEDPLVLNVNLVAFLKKNWARLEKGESLETRYAVWDRLETVGFSFKKMGETEISGEKRVKIQMKPTSFLISKLVDPLYFYFKPDGSQLKELDGRVAPKIKQGDSWKDLDAHIVYSY